MSTPETNYITCEKQENIEKHINNIILDRQENNVAISIKNINIELKKQKQKNKYN